MTIKYKIGQQLDWHPYYRYEPTVRVTVTGLRKSGCAMLSNGWVVDDEGVAEGTERNRGGCVSEVME